MWNANVKHACNYLASCPSGTTTLDSKDTKELLMSTGGMLMARGYLYDIVTKHLGVGVYQISLKPRN